MAAPPSQEALYGSEVFLVESKSNAIKCLQALQKFQDKVKIEIFYYPLDSHTNAKDYHYTF